MSHFKYGVSSLGGKYLGQKYLTVQLYNDADRNQVEAEIGKNNFNRLIIECGEMNDLEFLATCLPGGPSYLLVQAGVQSLSGLANLKNLIDLKYDLVSTKPYPNLSNLRNLESCFLEWDKKYDLDLGMAELFKLPKLNDLTLRNWSQRNCLSFSHLKSLRRLDLRQGALTSLAGLSDCAELTEVSLSYLPKLDDINALVRLPNLASVRIENCPKISIIDPITKLGSVKNIHIEKIGACLANIDWIIEMPNLEKACLSCEIISIDWGKIFNHSTLKNVAIRTHEGYSVSDEEINTIAKKSPRKIINFKRLGTKKIPAFIVEIE